MLIEILLPSLGGGVRPISTVKRSLKESALRLPIPVGKRRIGAVIACPKGFTDVTARMSQTRMGPGSGIRRR